MSRDTEQKVGTQIVWCLCWSKRFFFVNSSIRTSLLGKSLSPNYYSPTTLLNPYLYSQNITVGWKCTKSTSKLPKTLNVIASGPLLRSPKNSHSVDTLYCTLTKFWTKPQSCSDGSNLYSVAVAYAENFHGGVWFMVVWWPFVFGVRCLWLHNFTSLPCFQTNILAKFVDIICIFFYIHSLYFMCHCTEYKLSALQVRLSKKNKLNATTQQFITAKISGCALK